MGAEEDPGGQRPSLSPVEQFVAQYDAWLRATPAPGGGLDDRGHPITYPLLTPGADFELAEHFGWTWQDLQGTPEQIRALWFRMLMAKRRAEADAQESATRKGQAEPTAQDSRDAASVIAEAQALVAAEQADRRPSGG